MSESVFKTFKVEDKIEELKVLAGEEYLSVFKDKHVAIAVPVYDESIRNIELFDEKLFFTQQNDAMQLCCFLGKNIRPSAISIITTHRNMPTFKKPEYLILLHEFTEAEENNLLKELQVNGSEELKVYKLY